MITKLVVSGLIGGVIGYVTNFIAIRMLFYPKKKILGFQGLLAEFKDNFAEKTSGFVFQFIDYDSILEEMWRKKAFTMYVNKANWGFFRTALGHTFAWTIEKWLGNRKNRKYIVSELRKLTPKMKSLLSRKIAESDIDSLRNMILTGTAREIRFIQNLGGILGIIIGSLLPLIVH